MKLIPPADAMFLIGETREHPMHVAGLQIFDLPPDAGPDYVSELYRDLLTYTDVKPRLRHRPRTPVASLGQVLWVEDPDIDLEYHVRLSALPKPGRVRELLELVSRLHGSLLDRHRPLWEFYLIEGLDGGRFATYAKVHHALYDGIGATRLGTAQLSEDPQERDRLPFWANDPARATGRSLLPAAPVPAARAVGQAVASVPAGVRTVAGLGVNLARMAGQFRDPEVAMPFSAPRTILNQPISGGRRFAGDAWSIERMKKAGAPLSATLNDVFLAMCSGALRQYLLELDELPKKPLVAGVPVSLRGLGGEDTQGNAVGIAFCSLATDIDDPFERMAGIQASMNKAKGQLARQGSAQTQLMTSVMGPFGVTVGNLPGVARYAPPPMNVIISNVPGPRAEMFWNGARLEGTYPLSIPQEGQALNITCISYAGLLHFGLTGCRKTVPHLQHMLGHLEDSLAELES